MRRLSPAERRVLVGLTLGSAGLTGNEIFDPAIRWTHLGAVATHHGVAPLVYRGLRTLDRRGALPSPAVHLRDRCETLYVQNAARNTRLFAELERVLGPLRRAGIPVILLKGAAIARSLFGDIGLRSMRDLDLLVPAEARADALAALRSLGYRLFAGAPADLRARARRDGLVSSLSAGLSAEVAAGLYERYHFHYYLEREGQTFPVELHWHIVKPGRGGPIEDFWHEARPIRVGDVDALCFRPEHLLLHLALHVTADAYKELRLARLVDLHVAVATQPLDWAWLDHMAQRQHAVRALGVALGLARCALGTGVPASPARPLGRFDAALVALLGRRWFADLGLHPSDRMTPGQTLAWTIARRDRWSDVPGRLYRLLVSYPETNARLPDRYRGSELMNLLAALHPSRVMHLLPHARHRGRTASGATLSAVPKSHSITMIARLARTVRSLGRSAFRPALPEVAPPAPIDRADQLALLRLARAAVARHLGVPLADGMPPASPSLLQRTDPVFVAFWVDGSMRGCRTASGESLLRNTLIATRRTLEDARFDRLGRDDVDRLRIEIDVLGPSGPFRARGLPHFEPAIEPGIHGIIAERDKQRAVFKSSVGIIKNWNVEELIPRLCEKGGWAPEAYRRRDVRFSRFRSTAFIETSGGDGTQELLRANVPIGPADWSHDRIARAIEDGTEYLLRSQRSDGGFVYEYAPATAEYATGDNIVRQVATAWVLAALERRSGTARHRAALTRALDFISAKTRRAAPHSSALVVADDPNVAQLGTVAFGLLTVVTAGDDALRATAGRYADAILSLQQPDGRFHTHFPPATQPEAEDFYPGEAMLALMHLHMRDPDSRYPEALRRAFPYYREHFRRRRSTAFVAWQMAAYAHLFRLTRERQYADFVFEMADAILSIQHVGPAVPYPDYVGGYRSLRVPGVSSATYNEGVLEAYDLARQTGDRERAARYQRAALLGALFTLRLQFTRENAYYIAHADRVLGAFRASLADSTLRIDHTQHALNSLLKAERYFFQTGRHGDRETVSHGTPRPAAGAGRCDWATQHNEGRKEDVNARHA